MKEILKYVVHFCRLSPLSTGWQSIDTSNTLQLLGSDSVEEGVFFEHFAVNLHLLLNGFSLILIALI